MYSIGKFYSFRLTNSYHYTGKILEEDAFSVRILDIKNQEHILNKKEILIAVLKGEEKNAKAGAD